MTKIVITLILFFTPLFSLSKDGEEQKTLEDLIATTERQLQIQKTLKSLVDDFHTQQDLFYKGEQTRELAQKMVITAAKILKMSEENHYLHLFTPFFIEELKLFSGITKKKT